METSVLLPFFILGLIVLIIFVNIFDRDFLACRIMKAISSRYFDADEVVEKSLKFRQLRKENENLRSKFESFQEVMGMEIRSQNRKMNTLLKGLDMEFQNREDFICIKKGKS